MKAIHKILIIILIAAVVCSFPAYYIYCAVQYNKAITLVEQHNYSEAEEILVKYEKSNYFDDLPYVLSYARICMLGDTDSDTREIHYMLEDIPESYSGKFAEEISEIRADNDKKYGEYQERLQKAYEEAEAKRKAEMKTRMPYEGMSESYINDTMVGKADNHKYDKYSDKYTWYAYNGKDVVLIVECKDGKVTDIIKYWEGVYWNSDGTPNFGASKPASSRSKSKSSTKQKEDEYDVYDYSDPDDFYYDHEDEFDSYEDAEDYFDDAWE